MKGNAGVGTVTCLAVAFALALTGCKGKATGETHGLSPVEAANIATDAYVYGYPLITMDLTRRVFTNVEKPGNGRAPMGQFSLQRTYPVVSDHTIPAPSTDTLYVVGWLDVSREPWILSIPDLGDRYYLISILDAWTNVFAAPGTRTIRHRMRNFAISGPNWFGRLSARITEYKSPTNMVWIIGRIYCTGTPKDYAVVHSLQDQFFATPLSSFPRRGRHAPSPNRVDPHIDMKTAVRDQVTAMDANSYFAYMARLMQNNSPAPHDGPLLARMAKIGIVAGQPFDVGKLDPAVALAVNVAPGMGIHKILEQIKAKWPEHGWIFSTNTGKYGTEYLRRATVAATTLGASLAEDVVYLTSKLTDQGLELMGRNHNVLHFNKGQMPPVHAFWSLTMYDSQYFFVPNSLKRYTLSSRDKLVTNADGSVDVLLQADSPGKAKEGNWLPAPKDRFILMLRMYWPTGTPPSILDGTWHPPTVQTR